MDLYSLHASMEAVVSYLRQIDPDAALAERLPDPPHRGAPGATGTPDAIYARGIGNFMHLTGVPLQFAVSFGLLAFSSFVFDSLVVCSRLGRYVLEEMTGRIRAVVGNRPVHRHVVDGFDQSVAVEDQRVAGRHPRHLHWCAACDSRR